MCAYTTIIFWEHLSVHLMYTYMYMSCGAYMYWYMYMHDTSVFIFRITIYMYHAPCVMLLSHSQMYT